MTEAEFRARTVARARPRRIGGGGFNLRCTAGQVRVIATHRPPAPTSIGNSARTALVGGILASLALGLGMLLLRSTVGVRSIAERLLEWMLLLTPPGAFEATLQRFGFDAKHYALDAAVLALLVVSAWLGYEVLRRRWPIAAIGLLGPGVWLVIMLGVMPLTSAGLFATAPSRSRNFPSACGRMTSRSYSTIE